MSLVSLEGTSATRFRAQIPPYGIPWFDVTLSEPVTLSGRVTLSVGNPAVSIACYVWSGGAADGKAAYRLIAGRGGWGRSVAWKSYIDDAGVKVASVLTDAATDAGEEIARLDQQTRTGPRYARRASLASDVLHELAPRAWRVDFDGVTRLGLRSSSTYTGDAPRTRRDPAAEIVELATDDVTGFLPGVVVDGATATDVEYELSEKRLTVRLYTSPAGSSRLDAWRTIVHACDPRARYRGTFEFRVVSQTLNRVNLQPVRASDGLDDLRLVPMRPGVSGWKTTVTPGEIVLVTFIGGDPSRPAVIAHDDPDSPGWLPSLCEFGNGDFLAQKAAVDALQQAHDTHVHPHFLGPTAAVAAPLGPLASCTKLKGE